MTDKTNLIPAAGVETLAMAGFTLRGHCEMKQSLMIKQWTSSSAPRSEGTPLHRNVRGDAYSSSQPTSSLERNAMIPRCSDPLGVPRCFRRTWAAASSSWAARGALSCMPCPAYRPLALPATHQHLCLWLSAAGGRGPCSTTCSSSCCSSTMCCHPCHHSASPLPASVSDQLLAPFSAPG